MVYFIFSAAVISQLYEKVFYSNDVAKQLFGYAFIIICFYLYSYYSYKKSRLQRRLNDQFDRFHIRRPGLDIQLLLLGLYILSSLLYQSIHWLIWVQLAISLSLTWYYDKRRKQARAQLLKYLSDQNNAV